MFTYNLFTIENYSNLHVGSGDANYGVIDNLIQRDAITELPNINSSSLKGALREFIEVGSNMSQNTKQIELVFGSDPKDQTKQLSGKVRFFDATLLALPVRATNQPYYLATTKEIITEFLESCNTFGIVLPNNLEQILKNLPTPDKKEALVFGNTNGKIDDEIVLKALKNLNAQNLSPLFDDKLVLMHNDDFKEIAISLPVIARNQLENGESQNLFYEEVLPRKSKFFTFIAFPSDDHIAQADKTDFTNAQINFKKAIQDEIVQIGANGSIGYGMCKLTNIVWGVSWVKKILKDLFQMQSM